MRAVAKIEIVVLEDGKIGFKCEGQLNPTGILGVLEQVKLMVFQEVQAKAANPVAAAPPGMSQFLKANGRS